MYTLEYCHIWTISNDTNFEFPNFREVKTIILKISNSGVTFNNEVGIPLSSTNIPAAYLRFKESKPIYWEVEMISFSKTSKLLIVKVVNYRPENIQNFKEQMPKHKINTVKFKPLHWSELEGVLSTYQKRFLKDLITEEAFANNTVKLFKIPIKVPLSKLTFSLGYVQFTKTFKWNKGRNDFRIAVPESIPAYDYIKPYFTVILGKATIDVVIEVESSTSETKVIEARSIDLEKINDESIQILKVQKLDQWSSRKPKYTPPDQDIFTFEEAMESYGDEALGNIDVLEKDLLFHLLEKEDVRNSLQLRYLSERIHKEGEKLLMTLVPQFGFVFVHKGEEMTHFVWELLNSHATYIWSIPKGTRQEMIKRIEHEIRIINVQGRTIYKEAFEASENLFFHALRHRSNNYSYEHYFARWKKNLDNLLI